jgi:glycosyltransferase involved in cell wall biosynthesis
MKIVHIIPGTGGTFYCQNCMRDIELVRTLRSQGHDVLMVPVYLPLLVDAADISGDTPVFFGGINCYLQQKFPFFRNTPRWLDRLFDAAWMLRQAAKKEGSTEAAGLGPMTLSMLEGPDGHQKKELERLTVWLRDQEKPDVIHLSNALLLGMAQTLKESLDVPLFCSLQDEEPWIEAIDDPFRQLCWESMSHCAKHVDAFISVSRWYAEVMKHRMALSDDKVNVVHLGIQPAPERDTPVSFDPPVIGYLSKMTDSLGLGTLVDAFIRLKQHPRLHDLKLRATGGQVGGDIAYVKWLRKKLAKHGMENDAEFLEDFDAERRREFIDTLSVMSVPAPEGEAFGLFIIEALAAGVPVVQPEAGAFPEVVNATGGGMLYDPNDTDALVLSLEALLLDPERARALGETGRKGVAENFTKERMAKDMLDVYSRYVAS